MGIFANIVDDNLALLGLCAAATSELSGSGRKRAFVSITVGALLVAAPLAATHADAVDWVRAHRRQDHGVDPSNERT